MGTTEPDFQAVVTAIAALSGRIPPSELDARMKARGIGAAVRDRVLRLNPGGLDQGQAPRGWYPSQARDNTLLHGWVGKGAFIREHGRTAWDALPRNALRKRGKRVYVTMEAVVDCLWMLPADHPERTLCPSPS